MIALVVHWPCYSINFSSSPSFNQQKQNSSTIYLNKNIPSCRSKNIKLISKQNHRSYIANEMYYLFRFL